MNKMNEFYKSPHKKTSNTFYGVRGKKLITVPPSSSSTTILHENLHPSLSNHGLLSSINDLRGYMHLELSKTPLSSSNILLRIPSNDSHKRTPIGFMGLRGKRDSSLDDDQDSSIFALKSSLFLSNLTPEKAVRSSEQMDAFKVCL